MHSNTSEKIQYPITGTFRGTHGEIIQPFMRHLSILPQPEITEITPRLVAGRMQFVSPVSVGKSRFVTDEEIRQAVRNVIRELSGVYFKRRPLPDDTVSVH